MNKLTVVIASENPVKVQAALGGLELLFPEVEWEVKPVTVPSGVADQPLTDEETRTGAGNRVTNAAKDFPAADFWVGIEGGVTDIENHLAAFAWVVVKSKNLMGKARSGTFFLPDKIKSLIAEGMELGVADDQVFGQTNSKQKGGAVGLLTNNIIDRRMLYEQAVVLALIPFKNQELYTK